MLKINGVEITGQASERTRRHFITRFLEEYVKLNGGSMNITVEPGAGTNHIMQEFCKERGYDFREVRAAQLTGSELRPLPYIDPETHGIKQAPVDFLKMFNIGDTFTILVFDEYVSAPPAVKKVLDEMQDIPGVVIVRKTYHQPAEVPKSRFIQFGN